MELRDELAEIIRNAHFAAHPAMQFGYPEADALIRAGMILPPCKVGDTVWCISETKVVAATVDSITYDRRQECCVELNFRCEADCEGCPFADWSQSYCGEWVCSGEYGCTTAGGESFGKTVFLSRKEAEEALEF